MEALSHRYGWTPDQIRAMRLSDVQQYLEIIGEINRLEKMRQLRAGNRK
jgi:hypothetical protein